jgi:glycosyltransferase involved in cell wall biosynthesis
MRIAVLGIRGIPANYGGYETFAEHLAPELAARGHDVTVYGRSHFIDVPSGEYRGVRIVTLPTIRTKHLDTPVHTLLCCFHALGQHYDAILACNAANAIFLVIPRAFGIPVALNVDGIERLRKKWGRAGRAWYWLGEYLATKVPSAIVADADVVQDYYAERWHADSVMIPYGADTTPAEGRAALERLGLEPRGYVLVVTRLEPENNPDLVMRAFSEIDTDKRLVVVGDAPYATDYKRELVELASRDERIIMTGFLFGDDYRELQTNAACYVQATEVGGTHPALLEGMAMGGLVVVNGTPENLEVTGDAGLAYEPGDVDSLAECLRRVLTDPEQFEPLRAQARDRIAEKYSWDAVVTQYEELLGGLARERTGRRRRSGERA